MAGRENIQFELCAETLEACAAASAGGADRIELCRDLEVGGLTPDLWMIEAAVRQSATPVHVLLRPHADNFVSSTAVVDTLVSSIQAARSLGVAGVVCGLLHEDGTVDVEAMRALVQCADPLPVTFHRAFDATPDLFQALEDVISTGCARILTAGGAPDVLTGAPVLRRLVRQAGERVAIALGGGLRLENAGVVARVTGARHFHGSLRHGVPDLRRTAGSADSLVGDASPTDPSPTAVQQMISLLASAAETAGA